MTGIKLAARIVRALAETDPSLVCEVDKEHPHFVNVIDRDGRQFTIQIFQNSGPSKEGKP